MKQTSKTQSIDLLTKIIKKHRGIFTLNDASASTGISIDEAKSALDIILERYLCKLQVTENGDLIYNFGLPLKRRGTRSFKEIMYDIGLALWKAFTIIFKVWITVMLIVYFIIFVILLVMLVIASSSSKNKNKESSFNMLGGLGRIFIAIFQWNTYTGTIIYNDDRDGYRYKRYESIKPVLSNNPQNKKNLIASVYDFVFGPPRVKIDPLSNEKEVAEYLRKNKGILTLSELIALAGWTFDQAEMKLADYVSRFKGDTEISDNKVMYARFDRIIRSKSDYTGGKIVYYWDEYEPPYELTGNTGGKNFFIFIVNLFNLIMSLSIVFSHDLQHAITRIVMGFFLSLRYDVFNSDFTSIVIILLGIIPAVFSILFFLVPLLRIPYVIVMENKRKQANKRRRLIKAIFDRINSEKIEIKDIKQALSNTKERQLTDSEINTLVDKVNIELRGDKDITDEGKIVYSFHRIKDEFEEAKRIRQNIKLNDNLGKIEIDM